MKKSLATLAIAALTATGIFAAAAQPADALIVGQSGLQYRTPAGVVAIQTTCNPNDHTVQVQIDRGATRVSHARVSTFVYGGVYKHTPWTAWTPVNMLDYWTAYRQPVRGAYVNVYVELAWVSGNQWRYATVPITLYDQRMVGGIHNSASWYLCYV